jgi:Tfp pilus assembly protein PilF
MMASRLESLKALVDRNPTDAFLRYGLAMEYRNTGDLDAAMREFRALMQSHPDYPPAFFHGGQTLEKMGLEDEAREAYRAGVEAAAGKGDAHAQAEMQAALDMLG